MRPCQLGTGPGQLGQLLAAGKQVVPCADCPSPRCLRQEEGVTGKDEAESIRARRLQAQGHRRQHEHRKRIAARPHRVIHLAERRDVIRIEAGGALQRFDERDYGDSAWALCRAFEVAPAVARADAHVTRVIHDAEKKLAKDHDPEFSATLFDQVRYFEPSSL